MIKRHSLIDIAVVLIHETERAYLLDHGGKDNVWLPKSRCELDVNEVGVGTVTLEERLAEEKGMI